VLAAEPNLNPDLVAALWAPTASVTNPYEATLLLADHAAHHGVEIVRNSPVLAVEETSDGQHRLRTPTRTVVARFVVNAAGLYADEIARMAGVGGFTIVPRRGEEYLLDRRLAGIVSRLIFPCPTPTTKGVIVNPTVDGTIMVGPTAEIVHDKDDLRTTPAGAEAVFAAVQRLVPGLSRHDVIAEFAGNRAVLDTEDFLIGPTGRPGFLNAAGIQSPGTHRGPRHRRTPPRHAGSGRDSNSPPARRGNPTSPVRCGSPNSTMPSVRSLRPTTLATRASCVDANSSPRARCATGWARGSDTLDSLKFRTRVGMGRCQGAFCTLRCMDVLARELGVPLTALTKHGGESWLACTRDPAEV
jgi:glycerol-3-phosphate dehydrogenase